ncbi:MAG: adenylosuccinate lyase [Deltaproteobacteria bacterium RBG_13_52_11]|nr:MAG: adenylosuccinate lyase [Deltaproteobacteria bacterium RBG_13_52_11]
MIPRYTREKMGALWSDEHKYQTWLRVEILACEAWAELGEIPRDAVQHIKERARIDPKRIEAIERETKHDVAAFVSQLEETVGEAGRYIHFGLTSYDIVDTALSLRLREAAQIIIEDIDDLMEAIREKAFEHKETIMIGRTHGVHAEPITFGLKMALWYEEMRRHRGRMERAIDTISVGKLSGAVGTFANAPPAVEEYVCKKLGLKPAPVSSQIIQRDRHAEFFTALALLASSIEKFAVEIRHLQRTEVLEAEEPFAEGQKGSSAMPHKRNPIGTENLSGLARLVRSNSLAAMEDIPLWHERDISHSSVERIIAPDSTILTDYMLTRFAHIIRGLVVYPERMRKNLDLTKGLITSQQLLSALIRKGVARGDAYHWVQRNAMRAWRDEEDFRRLVREDGDITTILSEKEIQGIFDLNIHLKYVNDIYKRVFTSSKGKKGQ